MANDTITVEGLKQLDKQLAGLGTKVGLKALRGGMMAASKPMFVAAKANAAGLGTEGQDAGSTAAAMGRFTKKLSPTKTALFIGPKNASKRAVALWNAKHNREVKRLGHFHLMEFGSIHNKASPFMRPAFDTTAFLVVNLFGRELRKSIAKAVRKNAR
jgi:HK97 gp10 family phage protein